MGNSLESLGKLGMEFCPWFFVIPMRTENKCGGGDLATTPSKVANYCISLTYSSYGETQLEELAFSGNRTIGPTHPLQ